MEESENSVTRLTLNQELSVRQFILGVEKLSEDDAKQLCIQLYKENLIQKNAYEQLLKHSWGLDPCL